MKLASFLVVLGLLSAFAFGQAAQPPGLRSGGSGAASAMSITAQGETTARKLNDKDLASVLDYGAICDGSANDSAAFTRALATGKTVLVPKGDKICMVGDVALTGSDQRIVGHSSVVRPVPGSSRMFLISGYANGIEGLFIQDNGGLVAKVPLAAGAASGATVVTIGVVTSGPAVQVGQRYSIRLDNGNWATGFITAVSGETVTLRDPLPAAAASGNAFWSTFGVIQLANGSRYTVRDIEGSNIWGGILADSPGSSVSKGHVDRVNFSAGVRMFGAVKGRNASDNTFSRMQLWGGYYITTTAIGDGATTTYQLPQQLNLTRELTVRSGGFTLAIGTNYTVSANGLFVTFLTAPAAGVALSFGFQVYGHDGLVDDGRDATTATGGNTYQNMSVLAFRRCGVLKGAQLYAITGQSIFDTCQDYALLAEGTSQIGTISAFAGWGSIASVYITGNSAGIKTDDLVLGTQPAGYFVTGAAATPIIIDAGSSITGRVHSTGAGFTDYAAGAPAWTVNASGTRTWNGTAATLSLNPGADVLSFSRQGFVYISLPSTNGTLVTQAMGTNGAVQMQATSSVKMTVGASADAVVATATQVNVGSATQKVRLGGGTPAVSACGTSPVFGGSDQAGRVQQGSSATGCTLTFANAFASAPYCVVSSEAGLGFTYTVSATSLKITNSGALSGTKLNYMCTTP